MNKGIKKATGKYICFLNSDDFYTSNDVLEASVKKLEETESDYCVAPFDIIKRENDEFYMHVEFSPIEYFFILMTYNHETLVCKKSVYEELDYHNEKYGTTIDYAFNISLVLNDYKHTFISKSMITVRLGGGTSDSETGYSKETIKNVANLYMDIFDFYKFNLDVCKIMFLQKIFPPNFLTMLKRFMIVRELKNFNYLFFFDCINEIEKTNNQKWDNLVGSDFYKNKIKIDLFGIIRFNIVKKMNKTKYYIFRVPLITRTRKNNVVLYKLFNFIPFLKIKQ